LTKTAQAVVLAVAELSGGLEECDLSKIYGQETVDKDSTVNKDSTVDKDSTVESFISSTEDSEEEVAVELVDEVASVDVVDVDENEIRPQTDKEELPIQVDNTKKPEKVPVCYILIYYYGDLGRLGLDQVVLSLRFGVN